jgi:hypothetical protein
MTPAQAPPPRPAGTGDRQPPVPPGSRRTPGAPRSIIKEVAIRFCQLLIPEELEVADWGPKGPVLINRQPPQDNPPDTPRNAGEDR